MSLRTAAAIGFLLAAMSVESNTITTVDSGGVGQYTSVAYGSDGLALISYYDQTNGDLKVAHCLDVACTASTKTTLDSVGDVGRFTSIAIGTDGRGIISYLDVTNARLKVAHCSDVACSTASVVTLAGAGPVDDGTDIAVPPDTLPVIAFGSSGALRLARCFDAACTDATAVTVRADFGRNPSVAIGGDTLPLIAGDDGIGTFRGNVTIGHCIDAACTSATFITLPPLPSDGSEFFLYLYEPTLATAPNGLGVVAYTHAFEQPPTTRYTIHYAQCIDAACSALDLSGSVALGFGPTLPQPSVAQPEIAMRPDGRPILVGATLENGGQMRVGNCHDATCYGVVGQDVDGPGAGRFSSVAVSAAGLGLVAFHSTGGGGQLRTAYLDSPPEVADVSLDLTGTPAGAVVPGQLITYRDTIRNLGPGVARYVRATHTLAPEVAFHSTLSNCSLTSPDTVTCHSGDIAVNGGSSPEFVVRVLSIGSGSITTTATATAASTDPNLANNSDSHTHLALPRIAVTASPVIEGDSGLTEGRFDITLVDVSATLPPLAVSYATTPGSALPGSDYVHVSGSLTLSAAAPTQPVAVQVVGDLVAEDAENLLLGISGNAVVTQADGLLILDDDPFAVARAALAHGVTIRGDLAGAAPTGPEALYALELPAHGSFEIVVDDISGDLQPLSVDLLDFNGLPIGAGQQSPSGGSVRLMRETGDLPELNHTVRIRSGACTTCGPDDVYRVRAYETTARVARFNNSGGQVTVLLVQNTTDAAGSVAVDFWSQQGQRVGQATVSLASHRLAVIDTALHAPGQSGSMTIRHGFPYGTLQGKAVSLEPATGFSFDTPLEYRPR